MLTRDQLTEIDSLLSLVAHRYPSNIPVDVLERMKALSLIVRAEDRHRATLAAMADRPVRLCDVCEKKGRMGDEGGHIICGACYDQHIEGKVSK